MWISGRGRRRRRRRTLHSVYVRQTRSGQPHNSNMDSEQTAVRSSNKNSSSSSNFETSLKYLIIASSALFVVITPTVSSSSSSSSSNSSWRSSTGMGHNIRHLPCVSRRSGETGLCMFAYTCAKANGTHLGTCIDRFYFGSCCKLNVNNDPDLLDPISHNHINKDNVTSSTKTPYQRPSSNNPMDGASTISLPVSVSNFPTYPSSSLVSIPSSTNDLFTTMFVRPGSRKPSSSTYATSSASYSTVPVTSRIPVSLINATHSQSYFTPTHITTSPKVYSTSASTLLQTSAGISHMPVPIFQTTEYSKLATKPTSKPVVTGKPKPTQGPGKPNSSKPKPTKPFSKPSIITQSTYPSFTESPHKLFTNKTTLQSFSTVYSSKPIYTTSARVPTKSPVKLSPSSVPTPITLFTSSKKPTKVTNPPSAVYTTSPFPSSYIKLPSMPTSPQSHPPQQATVMSSPTHVSSTHRPSSEQNLKINNTEEVVTETPHNPSSSTTLFARPWTMPSIMPTPSQPALVTWTTVVEVPGGLLIPDRTKPTSIVRPTGNPPVTKPVMLPTFSKPMASSTTRPQATTKKDNENIYYLSMTQPSSSTVGSSSPGWVEVSVSTHAPTSYSTTFSTDSSDEVTIAIITQSSTKPTTTSINAPVTSLLLTESTPAIALETNEIDSSSINMSDYRDVCGRRFIQTPRIVGGSKSTFGKWPWQISLRQWRTSTYLHKCGAALFNENWAVTAAHCVENVPPGDLLLRLGEHDLSVEDEPYGYQERRVQIVASHPQFDPRTFEYDLALLRFYEPVKFQPNIIPVCVPEDDGNFVGTVAYVTGWGRLYEDGPLPSVLQEVSVPVINNSVCENMYQSAGYIEHIPNIFICAGWRKGGFDSCEGDSGGPMVIQRPDKRWLLAGIISWGIGCAEPNQPGVYTRISEFRDWINQILQF